MYRLAAIVALMFGVLLIGLTLDAVAHAYSGDSVVANSHAGSNGTHDRADHSHLPGDDLAHQFAFHGGMSAADLVLTELALPSIKRHVVHMSRADELCGITVPPPDRPPSR